MGVHREVQLGVIAIALAASAVAWPDGFFVMPERVSGRGGVASSEQKGVIIELPDSREVLLLQTDIYRGGTPAVCMAASSTFGSSLPREHEQARQARLSATMAISSSLSP